MSENSSSKNTPVDHAEVVQRRGIRISWAWLFPLIAAAATIWLFWSNWRSNGPEIEISFEDAPGIVAGKTPLLYRGVTAGIIKGVHLDKDLQKVVLTVRLKAFAADLAREGTEFWIDQPVVGLGETSGLDALIQGNSLEARAGSGAPAYAFTGLNKPPLTPLEDPELTLRLRAQNIPFLDRGSPLFYRGVSVGVVEAKDLDEKGYPYLRAVVEKEFAEKVRANSRFWPIPATSVKVGRGGVQVEMLGIKAILLGGVEFETFGDPGPDAADEAEFTLYTDEASARATGEPVRITFRNGQGLMERQTEVRYLGLPVGYVESVKLNPSTQSVDTIVRFRPEYDHLHSEGAKFTLIRPHISLDGITGLETLVGGDYIDCVPGTGGKIVTSFEGHAVSDKESLIAQSEDEGPQIMLYSKSLPPIGEDAPVLYRGVLAGRVKGKNIDPNGRAVLNVAIRKEFAQLLPTNARFWPIPATSIEAGPGVLDIDINGLQTLIQGGIQFDVFDKPQSVASTGTAFELYPSEAVAKAVSTPVRITFDRGQGILAGRTEVRYLGVPVGIVDSVEHKKDRIDAIVRFNAGYDFLRREGSDFSLVHLDISLKGVSGLETLVSGVYIECVPSDSDRFADKFTGVSTAKADFREAEEKGFEIVVTATQTNINADAPVSYRGVVVGKVARKVLANDGRSVGLVAIIDPPYENLIRENTKFWDAGGIKVSLGFLGLKVQTSSLESIARGGIAFATPGNKEMGAPVEPGHEFPLYTAPRREWLRWEPAVPTGD